MGPRVAVLSNVVASKQSLEALQQHGYSRLELRVRLGLLRKLGWRWEWILPMGAAAEQWELASTELAVVVGIVEGT